MDVKEAAGFSRTINHITSTYRKILLNPSYKYLFLLLGAPVHLVVFFVYMIQRNHDAYTAVVNRLRNEWLSSGYHLKLQEEIQDQLRRKAEFFQQQLSSEKLKRETERLAEQKFQEQLHDEAIKEMQLNGQSRLTFADTFESLIRRPAFFAISWIPGLLMYLMIILYSYPFLKFISERLVMTWFVILGVSVLVFSILYMSPMNPAANILGVTATQEQIEAFNRLHGLDQSYWAQLWNTLKGIFTFDLGKSFSGNEQVTDSIARKFPITLTLTVISLLIAMIIAIPIGIISATRKNSFWDYSFMFIALLGLSIPNFWQGLIFILGFSINLKWLPATYSPGNWLSMIMPVIVLGTALTASVARMTRSSTLEVIHEDYILTAKAKGISSRQVLRRHAVRNALIPIVTVIGLQFGAMLGGAAVTEKVFNISGIGGYIVDKQFIPDIPAVMGGVVYTAITISIVNVMIDMMYAFLDPRIRSRMKQY
ncbi:ABC transporter permease [Paenibacillus sp. JSM ZJ436]|uniref:ABC transporter permease n=1 Tax=Paenibacillus sp. JSM ZJ436 TaxID=3376190 RepID=UPI003793D93C